MPYRQRRLSPMAGAEGKGVSRAIPWTPPTEADRALQVDSGFADLIRSRI